MAPCENERASTSFAGLRPWLVGVVTASAGAAVLAVVPSPAPAVTVPRQPRIAPAGATAHHGLRPRVQPSGGSGAGTLDDGTDETDDDSTSPAPISSQGPRHRLEFTGVMGWPDFAMGCFFDPDSRGADHHGRRAVCVEAAVRPPVFGRTRVRGREWRH